MIYLVAERDNLFPVDMKNSPQVTTDFKSDTPTNGSSYASPSLGSYSTTLTTSKNASNVDLKEDDVDIQLDKIDGRIPRQRDPQLYDDLRWWWPIEFCFFSCLDVIIMFMVNVYIVYRLNRTMKNFCKIEIHLLNICPFEPTSENCKVHREVIGKVRRVDSSERSIRGFRFRTTFANLENINCSIKEKCSTGHAPWPKGKILPVKMTVGRKHACWLL